MYLMAFGRNCLSLFVANKHSWINGTEYLSNKSDKHESFASSFITLLHSLSTSKAWCRLLIFLVAIVELYGNCTSLNTERQQFQEFK